MSSKAKLLWCTHRTKEETALFKIGNSVLEDRRPLVDVASYSYDELRPQNLGIWWVSVYNDLPKRSANY